MALLKQAQLEDLNKMLDERVRPAQKVVDEWKSLWDSGLDYVFNNQLANHKRNEGWDRIQVNFIYPAVEQTMAILAQRRPKLLGLPVDPSDKEWAELWQGILQFQFERVIRMPHKLVQCALDGATCGFYVAKHFWEKKAEWSDEKRKWIGKPKVNIIKPTYFAVDACAETMEDAGMVRGKRRIPVDQAVARWPAFADELKAAATLELEADREGGAVTLETVPAGQNQTDCNDPTVDEARLANLLRASRADMFLETATDPDEKGSAAWVTIEEIYWRDEEEKEQVAQENIEAQELIDAGQVVEDEFGQFLDPQTKEPVGDWPTRENRWMEPTYPRGRFVIRVGGNDKTILNPDTEQQKYPYRKWPFTVGVNSVLPHIWQGLNDVEVARGPQDWINLAYMHIAMYVKQFSDPIWAVETDAIPTSKEGKKAKSLAARAGAIITFAKGALSGKKAERQSPPSMSGAVVQFAQLMSENLKDLTGVQDIALGKQMAGQQTLGEINKLESNTGIRTGLKSILMDDFTVRVFEGVGELDQMNMDLGEMRRIAGVKGKGIVEIVPEMMSVQYDLRLEVGTAMPQDREKKQMQFLQLYPLVGEAMLPELLEIFEVLEAEEILERHQLWQQFLQYVEMMEQQAQEQEKTAQQPQTPQDVMADEVVAAQQGAQQ